MNVQTKPISASALEQTLATSDVMEILPFGWHRRGTGSLRPNRFKQHVVSMEIEKLLLTACECANIDGLGRIDPHSLKRGVMRNRRNNQPPVVFKAGEAAIEQVIDARRQQQSVLAV